MSPGLVVAAALGLGGAALLGARLLGARRWSAGTRALRERLEATRALSSAPAAATDAPTTVDLGALAGLPPPVQRYLRAALTDGQPLVTGAHIAHRGTFDMGERSPRWRPFTSDQRVVAHPPGFDWDGRIAALPGVPVRVHDAYIGGEGLLQVALLGLVPLVDLGGTDDLAEGELMRFLAEAVWLPTALLPGQGVRWAPVDGRSADATLADGERSVTLRFTFGEAGLVETVSAAARARTVGRAVVPTPWQGRFWNHAERGGMRVPLEGEVAWLLPDGPRPYWRGRITAISHQLAR